MIRASRKRIDQLPQNSDDEDASGDDQIGSTGNFWNSLMRQKKKRDRRWLLYSYWQQGQGKFSAGAHAPMLGTLYISPDSTHGI